MTMSAAAGCTCAYVRIRTIVTKTRGVIRTSCAVIPSSSPRCRVRIRQPLKRTPITRIRQRLNTQKLINRGLLLGVRIGVVQELEPDAVFLADIEEGDEFFADFVESVWGWWVGSEWNERGE